MQQQLPIKIERELEFLGVLSPKPEEIDDPITISPQEYKIIKMELDENGEPPF